jgi:L-Lysine epsilon oxidase N-terminal/L-lysine epsilon oxidase C-terminal domain
MTMASIQKLKIHPSIGVARIGNHPTEFYIGPEFPNGYIKPDEIGDFKAADADDANTLKIKRQGARFRVFAYYDDGQIKELNSENSEITWSVKIANAKARSKGFYGINAPEDALRNNFVVGETDRKSLGLEPQEISISGNGKSESFEKVKFKVKDTDGTILSSGDILLGECKTDEKGRLIVLGGLGNTNSVKNHPITEYDDNDYWYDDIADGYVKARVKITETGEVMNAADAWVLCTPPRYVPELRTIVTLYDALFNKHWNEGRLQADAKPKFYRDIYPILRSAGNVPQLHEMSGHFSLQALLRPNSLLPARRRLYDKLRKPDGAGGPGANMPKMFGDGYGSASLTRLSLTSYQLLILSQWKEGDVEIDDIQNSLPSTEITPAGLDRAALENCIGGAFYPGIEASWFLRDKYQFIEPFRLDSSQLNPGDVTKQMALPWQADFWACAKDTRNDGVIAWWVFARPDDVFFEGADEMHPWTPPDEFGEYEDMVKKWMKLGFVVEKDGKYVEVQRQIEMV